MGQGDNKNQMRIEYREAELTAEEREVWAVLSMCRGRELAILGPEIEALTGIRYKQIQKIVSHLVCDHNKPIGSGTVGYYIPQTIQEREDAAYYLRHRAIVALYRAGAMQKATIESVLYQARMEFEGAA
jgi:hypothetical protein